MKALIIVLLIVASVAIVGLITYRKVMEYLENASEFSKEKTGLELTKKLIMVAHRGKSCTAPENSLAAFKLATESGFKYIETDIHLSKDGHWVIMHDPTVDRMTDGTGEIKSLTLEQLKGLKIDRGSGIKKYPDEHIPTLKEYLDVVTGGGCIPIIEIKIKGHYDFKDLVYTLREYNLTEKAIVIDYDTEQLMTIRKLCPELKMQILCHNISQQFIDKAEEIGNCGLDVMYNFLSKEDLCRQLVDKGMSFNCWTIDSEAALEKIYKFGSQFATTNCIQPLENQKDN